MGRLNHEAKRVRLLFTGFFAVLLITWEFIEIASSFDDFLNKLFRLPPLDPKKLKPSYGRKK
jgi:hypothetical protein